jgi:hypothetical protein
MTSSPADSASVRYSVWLSFGVMIASASTPSSRARSFAISSATLP